MRFVSVDIGNSRIKLRVSEESESQVARSEQTLAFLLPAEPLQWFVSSVNSKREQQLESWVRQQRPDDRWTVLQQSAIPLPVAVDHPSQVGKDRLLAALAARHHVTNSSSSNANVGSCIVVDSGTAVTIDLVSAAGVFQGGVIYPGIESSFQQLAQRTAALPGLDYESRLARLTSAETLADPRFGRNTVDAILLGVYQSQVSAINAIVAGYLAEQSGQVFLTGGGIAELDLACQSGWLGGAGALWPDEWIAKADLVLEGISLAADVVKDT